MTLGEDLLIDLEAGDWSDCKITPRILEWLMKEKLNNSEGIMVKDIPGIIKTDYQGKKIYEIKKAKIYGFSKNDRDLRNDLRDATLSILEDGDNPYDYEYPEENNENRNYSFRIIIKRVY